MRRRRLLLLAPILLAVGVTGLARAPLLRAQVSLVSFEASHFQP